MNTQIQRSPYYLGNLAASKDYAWGNRDSNGCRYIHSLSLLDKSPPLQIHPREFHLSGILRNGLECDFRSFDKLSRIEPKALLVAPDDEWSAKKHNTLLKACDALERLLPDDDFVNIAGFTSGAGVVLSFPKVLHVCPSCSPPLPPLTSPLAL